MINAFRYVSYSELTGEKLTGTFKDYEKIIKNELGSEYKSFFKITPLSPPDTPVSATVLLPHRTHQCVVRVCRHTARCSVWSSCAVPFAVPHRCATCPAPPLCTGLFASDYGTAPSLVCSRDSTSWKR